MINFILNQLLAIIALILNLTGLLYYFNKKFKEENEEKEKWNKIINKYLTK